MPRSKRTRKGIEITLSDDAKERLEKQAAARGKSRSQVVEEFVMAAPIRVPGAGGQ